eukprot:gene27779-36606_t
MLFIPGECVPSIVEGDGVIQRYLPEKVSSDSLWAEEPTDIDSKDKDTPDNWIARHPQLVRLTGRHPFNCEAPLELLMSKGFITPSSLHYVRTHGSTPVIKWEDHKIYLGGQLPKPRTVSMADILSLPRYSLPVTLVCCGNRRKEQNLIKQTIGFNWGAAGVSTGIWTGARLIDVLRLAGIESIEQFPPGLFVRFASEHEKGGDKLPGGVYGTSIPLEKALDPSQDVIIAYMYNGKLLTPDHGFPVRLIIPGYIGGRMIKWITNIDLQPQESQDYYHYYDNRVLPPHVDAEIAKDQDWWHKPEYICNDLNINSAISSPAHNEELSLKEEAGWYTLRGYAYTGGGRQITRVEVSFDSGYSWKLATLHNHEIPNRYGKYWCWRLWQLEASHHNIRTAHEIVLRAWDSSTNTQPDKPTWNLMGMLNNPWFRVKIRRCHKPNPIAGEGNGVLTVRFEHPTLAGNQAGGWMSDLKEHPSLTAPGVFVDPKTALNDLLMDSTASVPAPPPVAVTAPAVYNSVKDIPFVFDPSQPSYSLAEVAQHSDPASPWIVVNNRVYDCTEFLRLHPGGADSILINAGTDSSEEFDAIHSLKAWKMLDKYYIGQLRPEPDATNADDVKGTLRPVPSMDAKMNENAQLHESLVSDQFLRVRTAEVALNPTQRIPFTLIEHHVLSPDSVKLRFSLKHPQQRLGLPVGQHLMVAAKIEDKLVIRAYTPISSDDDLGYFDLVIKIYRSVVAGQGDDGEGKKHHSQGGKMSQYLGSLLVGDSIDVKGPIGHVTYVAPGRLSLHKVEHSVSHLSMLCAGSGITPVFQFLRAILRNHSADKTKISMIYANRYEVDILLREELDSLALSHPDQFSLHYVLSRPGDSWAHFKGHVSASLVGQVCPRGDELTYALLCGPPGFIDEACVPALRAHDYDAQHVVQF